MLLIFIAASYGQPYAEASVILCEFSKSDVKYDVELTDFAIYGPEETLEVGDAVVVFFTLKYVGSESQISFDKIFVAAKLPDGSEKEFEDKSYRGVTLAPGESIRFHIEVELNQEGIWVLWPSFIYHYGSNVFGPLDPWHECTLKVGEKQTTTTTTPQPMPDLAFDPQYFQPVGYEKCKGFYAHIKNIGDAETPSNFMVTFLIYSGSTLVEKRDIGIPALTAGEEYTVYSGVFIGVPNTQYNVKVILNSDGVFDERSDFNNARDYQKFYTSQDLPVFDLEVKDLMLLNSTLKFKVKHTGCLESPPTIAYLGVWIPPEEFAPARMERLASTNIPRMFGVSEIEIEFPNIEQYIASNPDISHLSEIKFFVEVEAVRIFYNAHRVPVSINETSLTNNIGWITLGEKLFIEGSDTYFLPKQDGTATYTISNPTSIWPAVGGISPQQTQYRYEIIGCGAQISYDPENPTELEITVPEECDITSQLELRIYAENMGLQAFRSVKMYFYRVFRPITPLISDCVPLSTLDATNPFLFTDRTIRIRIYPPLLLMSVTHIYANGPVVSKPANATIELRWTKPNGAQESYILPQQYVELNSNLPGIIFEIPSEAVFHDLETKAIQVDIYLHLTFGSGQSITIPYRGYWLHSGTYPVYLRSFHFKNTGCGTTVSWSMWEDFWGRDAVMDCIGDACLFPDIASKLLYEYVFKEMCNYGRCFSYALSGQKFFERHVEATGRCRNSKPQPFTVPLYGSIFTREICEATGDSCLGLADWMKQSMSLNKYLTYQYMWALDERNLFRGLDKFERYLLGEDIVLETLNELREWENLPEDEKWQSPYIIMMIPPCFSEVRNAHAVLAYHVEEKGPNNVRIWVIDSNRPFQPNNATNQNNSYIDFFCCGPDGRWNFRFEFDDGKTLSDFLFASPTSMFHGETAAFTEADFIRETFNLIRKLFSRLGSATNNVSSENNKDVSLYIVGVKDNSRLLQVRDSDGRVLLTNSGMFETNPKKRSYKIAPLLILAGKPAFVALGREPVEISLQNLDSSRVSIVSRDVERTLLIEYNGKQGGTDKLLMSPNVFGTQGNGISEYHVITRLDRENAIYEITVYVRENSEPFLVNFSVPGRIHVTNFGEENIVFDLRLMRYDGGGVDGEIYDGISVGSESTLEVYPESWDHLSEGNLIIRVDNGSDGSFDFEEKLEPNRIRPVAIASDVYAYANESGYATVVLDGSLSYSPQNKPLTWRWKGNFLEGAIVEGEKVEVTLPMGTWIVELTVSDGELDSIPITVMVYVLSEEMKNATQPKPQITPPFTPKTKEQTQTTTEETTPPSRTQTTTTELSTKSEEKTSEEKTPYAIENIGLVVIAIAVVVILTMYLRKK
ncbi:MAG: hypothetical protein B6U76_07095 [Desulfurococcales archaeon ex4484_217_2]|nr:MAG: hypothetical protein B6U76_07095 [Desulfurococcales archaeon ex4484_217_2]